MMAEKTSGPDKVSGASDPLTDWLRMPAEWAQTMIGQMLPQVTVPSTDPADAAHWAEVAGKLQAMWLGYQTEAAMKLAGDAADKIAARATPASEWMGMLEGWQSSFAQTPFASVPFAQAPAQQKLWDDGMAFWQGVLGQYGIGPEGTAAAVSAASAALQPETRPDKRPDKRFAAAQWREQPFYAMIHQTYVMLADQMIAMADSAAAADPEKAEQLRFATRALVDALSPDHFPLTNPLVIERAMETRGTSLLSGMEHLITDLRRGQLTHTDPEAFTVGENIAITPGKVVHETPLYQLIQYTPTTDNVLAVPLVIFPPWINRFYILDLNPKKSFVRWAVAQGISTFMVSWKSADASMADVVWDDYIAAQIEAIEVVRARLEVPAIHTIGYCVAGTTLAATLAVLAARGQADKVASATFFTAQVDFAEAGELMHFIDDQQIAALDALAPEGYLDGRYMAAAFNLLRGNDLIWSYVVNNYLLGMEYQPFDLLHWNGDTTNLPAKWHGAYLRDLYRDNLLVQPGRLSAGGTPIDLTAITTPCFIQAGREDHIAPPGSVWQLTRHLAGPWQFVLAGSGHIAGVVNPPEAGKYQYWTNPAPGETLDDYIDGAEEHKGSWWPHWREWLRGIDPREVAAAGHRVPGGQGDTVIEDAPGRYVRMR